MCHFLFYLVPRGFCRFSHEFQVLPHKHGFNISETNVFCVVFSDFQMTNISFTEWFKAYREETSPCWYQQWQSWQGRCSLFPCIHIIFPACFGFPIPVLFFCFDCNWLPSFTLTMQFYWVPLDGPKTLRNDNHGLTGGAGVYQGRQGFIKYSEGTRTLISQLYCLHMGTES